MPERLTTKEILEAVRDLQPGATAAAVAERVGVDPDGPRMQSLCNQLLRVKRKGHLKRTEGRPFRYQVTESGLGRLAFLQEQEA